MKETGTRYRGLATHKITPMLGVLHTEDSTARFGKALPFRSTPVMPYVRRL